MKRFCAQLYPRFSPVRLRRCWTLSPWTKPEDPHLFQGHEKAAVGHLRPVAQTDYIFCDETFDGLDPVMRQAVKGLFAADVAERELTPIIASHNLRELEDICDHVGLLHKGGILLSRDLMS